MTHWIKYVVIDQTIACSLGNALVMRIITITEDEDRMIDHTVVEVTSNNISNS